MFYEVECLDVVCVFIDHCDALVVKVLFNWLVMCVVRIFVDLYGVVDVLEVLFGTVFFDYWG